MEAGPSCSSGLNTDIPILLTAKAAGLHSHGLFSYIIR